jgi:hypothetical protein
MLSMKEPLLKCLLKLLRMRNSHEVMTHSPRDLRRVETVGELAKEGEDDIAEDAAEGGEDVREVKAKGKVLVKPMVIAGQNPTQQNLRLGRRKSRLAAFPFV